MPFYNYYEQDEYYDKGEEYLRLEEEYEHDECEFDEELEEHREDVKDLLKDILLYLKKINKSIKKQVIRSYKAPEEEKIIERVIEKPSKEVTPAKEEKIIPEEKVTGEVIPEEKVTEEVVPEEKIEERITPKEEIHIEPAIIEKEKIEEKEHVYIFYPIASETKDVDIGDVLIDFIEGKIEFPDGTMEYLSTKLAGTGHEYVRSIVIGGTNRMKITIDDAGAYWASKLSIRKGKIQRIKLTIDSTDTSIAFTASTDPLYEFIKETTTGPASSSYEYKTSSEISSTTTTIISNTSYTLPDDGDIDTRSFDKVTFAIYADQPVTAKLQISLDNGSTYIDLAGYSIDEDQFEVNKVNTIPVAIPLERLKLVIITGSTPPSIIKTACYRKL